MFTRLRLPLIVMTAVGITASALWFSRASANPMIGEALRELAEASRAKAPPAKPQIPAGPHPKIVIDNFRHNFGSMIVGEEQRHTFMIRNAGDALLRLTQGDTSCKCTFLNLANGELAPGESTNVELSWKPIEVDPQFLQSAAIETNDPERPRIRLVVHGKVSPPFTVLPDGIWQAGEVLAQAPTTVSGTVCSAAVDHFQILKIESSNAVLSATTTPLELTELDRLGAKSGYEIRATLASGLPVGFVQHTLTLRTDLPGGEEVPIVVSGEQPGPIRLLGKRWSIEERKFHLGNFSAREGRGSTLSIFVRTTNEADDVTLEVASIEPASLKVTPRLDAAFKSMRQKHFEVEIEYPAGAPPISLSQGNTPGHIEFRTNVAGAENFSVPIDFVAF